MEKNYVPDYRPGNARPDAPPAYDHNMGHPVYTTPPQPVYMTPPQPSVVLTNVMATGGGAGTGCPLCHNNDWTGTYSCCAWLCCICLFPIGIVCCLCMRKKKCSKCGFTAK